MKRQGFTLIELLAVIVVLAIIALIATPIVMNTIESSKKGATIESVRNMVHAAELYFISENPRYGKLNLLDDKLDYDGQKPELGEVEVNKNGDSRVYVYINGYCVTKEYDSELYASKTNKEECNWYATDNYETIEGTTFTLNNQKIKNYLIYGNSTQDTRSGKNLFDYSYLNSTYSINGLTMTSTDDVITINGTLNKQGNLVLSKNFPNKFDTSKTYTLKIHVIGGNAVIGEGTGITFAFALFNSTNTKFVRTDVNSTSLDNIASVTFSGSTFEGDENLHLLFQNWRLESTYNNYQVKIQIEEGSTATEYEEYGMMPSPEFPSEIKNTGDLVTKDNCASYGSDACDNIGKYVVQVKATGKNLFDKSKYLKAEDYTKTNNSYNVAEIKLKPNTTYKISVKRYNGFTGKDDGYLLINSMEQVNGSNWASIAHPSVPDYSEVNYIYTTSENGLLYIGYAAANQTNLDNIWKNTDVQIEEGTSATTYESYREATTNIYLDGPLRKVGDYADYIDYNNKKIVRNVKERVYTGKESWLADNGDASYAFDSTEPYIKNSKGLLFSNIAFYASTKNNDNFNFARSGAGYIEFNALNKGYTVETWKQYLADKYNSGSPVKVQYDIATPIEESIDLPSIELLDGYNTLSINTEVSPSNVKLTTSK